jgi:hypothetical protein
MSRDVKITIKNLTSEMVHELNAFNRDVYLEIVKTTPKRTGAASRAWTKPEKVSATDFNKVISTNALNYVPILEEGSSKQAPAGFIQPSIDKITRRYRR